MSSNVTSLHTTAQEPNLQDQVVVITGGNQGLGRALATAFAQAGARLVLAARNEARLEETAHSFLAQGVPTLAVPTDVSQEAEVAHLMDLAQAHFGQIDILINNAAIHGPTAPLAELSLAQWNHTLNVDLTGPFLCCREALRHMLPRRQGTILNIASIYGPARSLPFGSPYAAAKAGLVGLTMTLAQEVAEEGIRVHAMLPGPMAGESTERILQRRAERQGRSLAAVRREMQAHTGRGRLLTPHECAAEALLLCADEAAESTGRAIDLTATHRFRTR